MNHCDHRRRLSELEEGGFHHLQEAPNRSPVSWRNMTQPHPRVFVAMGVFALQHAAAEGVGLLILAAVGLMFAADEFLEENGLYASLAANEREVG